MIPMSSVVKKAAALLSLSLLLSLYHLALAQTKPKVRDLGAEPVRSVLWVGNSFFYYNNGMQSRFRGLVKATHPRIHVRAVMVTISGSGLDWHDMASYLRPNGIGKYSFVAGNKIVFNKRARQFDTVIMMDCSQCPIHPRLKSVFHEYVKKDSEIIRKAGARPVLFMSWAYKDRPEMTAELAEQYTIAGNDNDALVIPAGLAFAKAISKRPDLEFYQADKRHPTLIGTYLAACTSYAALYGKSPIGNTYTAGVDASTAKFLQTVAWETVKEYFAK